MTKKQGPVMGRPTKYTKALALKICRKIAEGVPLTKVVKEDWCPGYSTIMDWRCPSSGQYNKQFSEMYDRSRDDQADFLIDEMLEIADNNSDDTIIDPRTGNMRCDYEWVQRSRLRVDTRKFVAAKMKPRTYGDTAMIKHTADNEKGNSIKLVFEDWRGDTDPSTEETD